MSEKLPIWKRRKPAGAKKSRPLSPHQIEAARERARLAGRRYPNLVDNLWAARYVAASAAPQGILQAAERDGVTV